MRGQARPGQLNAPKGGALAVSLAAGPLPAVTALAFRGDCAAACGRDLRPGRLVGPSRRAARGAISEIAGPVHALAFSRDGRRLALGAGLPARSGVVRVYTVPDGTLIHDFTGHDRRGVRGGSAARRRTACLGLLRPDRPAVEPRTRNFRRGLSRTFRFCVLALLHTRWPLAFFLRKDRTIKRINTRTLKEERTYSEHNEEVFAVAAHPDGKRFVSAGGEPQIRWWSYDGEKSQTRRGGHSGSVHQLAFSGDGRWLISSGSDNIVRLWNGRRVSRSSSFRPPNGSTPRPFRTTASLPPAAAGTAWSASGI